MRLIDGDRLEEVLTQHRFSYCGENEWNKGVEEGLMLANDDVIEAPTIDAEPTRHGKWIKVGDNTYRCSRCNEVSCCNGNFCTDCGARMENDDSK